MDSTKDAHCLMELSEREWNWYIDSSIHVSGRVEEPHKGCTHILYENIEFGSRAKIMKRRSICNGKTIWWEEVNLPRIKISYFIITTSKAELIKDTTIHIVDTASRTDKNDTRRDKYKASGIVLLLICRLDAHCGRTEWAWGKKHLKTIKSSKTNFINANTGHFGSEGYYFSYGNKGNSGIFNSSSVGQYVNRKFKNKLRSTTAAFDSSVIEEMAA